VTDGGTRHLEQMRRGLVPRWAKAPTIGSRLLNARAEALAEKPAFRDALRRRSARIPADGFFEGASVPGQKAKPPTHVRPTSGEPSAFAGLWVEWTPTEGGDPLRSGTSVTTEPDALMATFRHRTPVIPAPEAEAVWLAPGLTDPGHPLSLLVPCPAEAMTASPVSPAAGVSPPPARSRHLRRRGARGGSGGAGGRRPAAAA
jgi:putative SOS response-associated peptidase YedK